MSDETQHPDRSTHEEDAMSDQDTRTTAQDVLDRGRAAVERGVRDARDAVDEVRDSSSFGDAARSAGRRIRRLRDEQPLAFGIGVAVSALVLAGLVARAQR
ncbi:EI24 domain-containing protein [Agrococcus jejuensis]|uniref:EI24 domain-containing protein n=1 Tax=Agrococcus jejuensis TaxID=399736 RepID=UPI001643555D|nr:EI24 domain-containing protein [Agrococcus jejuensis]